jgi:hypothetical protein
MVAPAESVSFTVKVAEPAAFGVPEIVKVPALALGVMSEDVKPVLPPLKVKLKDKKDDDDD